ncbi:hypothetical protein HZ996_12190 [Cryomorphaceae bacterium]|nr:hypothetical protein HZ996_12190 [Cryomorphaceae bacterium]
MKLNPHMKSFTAGVLACASLFAIYSFTVATPQEGGDGISVTTAKALHDNYLGTNPASVDGPLQAIQLSSTAVAAAQDVLSQNGDADGVRIYYGVTAEGDMSNVVVATEAGSDLTEGYMIATPGGATNCPQACDMQSPIMK